jgi:hypothetical protein
MTLEIEVKVERRKIDAAAILEKLHERYPRPAWASFVELRDAAGYEAFRTLDFWAMHTWPSKGFLRVAVEIKVTRSDFLRELNEPGKRAGFEAISHEFYFAAPTGLIKPAELPEGVGLLEATAKTLRAKMRAKQRQPADPDVSFVAVLLKAAAAERQRLEKQLEHVADFAGRPVGLNDLRRLAGKLRLREENQLRQEIRAELEGDRRRSAKIGDGDLSSWWPALRQLRATAHDALGLKWDDEEPTPDQVLEWLRKLPHRKVGEIARRAREWAEAVLGP